MSGQLSKPMEGLPTTRTPTDIYFCVLCPNSEFLKCDNKSVLEQHLRQCHLNNATEEEKHAIDLWIDRHIKYLEALSKAMAQPIKTIPDRSKTLYKGCLVCDRIIEVYKIRNDPNPSVSHELVIRDINVDYSGNNVNHINPHLKYYPYECLLCESECEISRKAGDPELKEVVKTAVKAMMRRHIIDRHLKTIKFHKNEFEEVVEKSMRTLKVTELEKLTKRQTLIKLPAKRKKPKSVPGPPRVAKAVEVIKRPMIRPIIPTLISSNSLMPSTSLNPKIINNPLFVPIAPIGAIGAQKNLVLTSVAPKTYIIRPQTMTSVLKTEVKAETQGLSSSEEEWSDKDFEELNTKNRGFGCVFCYKRFVNFETVFEHYLRHSKVFIECAKCDLKFKTIADFRTHNPLHNENINFLNLDKFKIVRKWVEKFLNYMTHDRQLMLDMTLDTKRVYCPVCLMVSNNFNFESNKVLGKDESIESHIHNHMNYFPFECIDCSYEDIKTEYYLDSNARKHLYEKHDIKNASNLNDKELTVYFTNTNTSVDRFDELIRKCVDITNEMNEFWIINSKDSKL